MPMHIKRIRKVPVRILREIEFAEPPAKLPRGFFDALVTPTRKLIEKGLNLKQAAQWLMCKRILKRTHADQYHAAMCARFSRFRRKAEATATVARWRTSIMFDSMHAVPEGGLTALCGVHSCRWNAFNQPMEPCNRCKGIVRSKHITITGEIP